jgi:hypothetical protein
MHCPACIRNGLPTRGEQVLGGGERTGVRAVRPPPTAGSDPGKTTAKGRSCYTERITHHRNGLEPRLGWRGSEAGAMGERRNEKTPGGQGSGASSGQINQHFPMPFAYNRLTRDHFRSRNHLYVLDGLLENDTILRLREHSTDTHGYTEHLFGLCYLLGFSFMPRLRGLAISSCTRSTGARPTATWNLGLRYQTDKNQRSEVSAGSGVRDLRQKTHPPPGGAPEARAAAAVLHGPISHGIIRSIRRSPAKGPRRGG